MNAVKKLLGYVWMLMAPALICFLVYQAVEKISAASDVQKANITLQWVIILLVFIPICVGFFIWTIFLGYNRPT
jgi:hypothetical protein